MGDLVNEMLERIFYFCDPYDLDSLAATCKFMRQLAIPSIIQKQALKTRFYRVVMRRVYGPTYNDPLHVLRALEQTAGAANCVRVRQLWSFYRLLCKRAMTDFV